jgi:MFS family permease
MGPIFGGILTSVWGWRSIFWFLAIICGTTLVSFVLFFQDTFRCERSLTYQRLLKQRLRSTASLPLSYPNRSATFTRKNSIQTLKANADIEKTPARSSTQETTQSTDATVPVITLSFRDVNPFHPIAHVVRRPNNLLILLSSGVYVLMRTTAQFN